ncbi:TPA: fimbrial protein [Vibrio cholerae]|uniref:fimbrial protein n=1 Tax=Vibrio cholerae TaxID=666 RepID=UPI0029352E25|nr:fimbrial protein [Vibrio cholerae]MDV2305934.1 fimbrial protein [Vibrio cholerae]
MKKTIIVASMLAVLSSGAFAAAPSNGSAGGGQINFTGSIIDSPCSIAPSDSELKVDLGQISNSVLKKAGESEVRPFTIHLESCSTETLSAATVRFNGDTDTVKTSDLKIMGTAKGAAIELVDAEDNSPIAIGSKTKPHSLVDGDNALEFGAHLVSTLKDDESGVPGDFAATATFEMFYQ